MNKILVLFTLLFALAFGANLLSVENPIADQYIVVFHENVTNAQVNNHFSSMLLRADNSTAVIHRYSTAIKGYSIKMPKLLLSTLLSDPMIDYIEQDQMMHALGCNTQTSSKAWGIARVSSATANPVPTSYIYSSNAGSGVTAYIIDTGILVSNVEFGTRARFGFKATSTWSDTDGNGHGTHVASTVAGATYGLAKNANLVAVKVLSDSGSGSNSGVIAGVDWVAQQGSGKKSIANMSLGGGYSAASNAAVDNCVKAGVLVAVAAGNDNKDASNYSPASSALALTVGATAQTNNGGIYVDTRSTFSNYGATVDVFAPGTGILGAYIGSNTATATLSGTSMASPHACGVGAVLLGDDNYNAGSLKAKIISLSKQNLITMGCGSNADCAKSPNKLLFNPCP